MRIHCSIVAITERRPALPVGFRSQQETSPPPPLLLRILRVALSYANILRHMSIISRAMDNYKEELSHK